MITNERQYKITRAEVARFEQTLKDFTNNSAPPKDVHPRLLRAQKEALESQLESLKAEVREYEKLKSGEQSVISIDSLEDFAEGLIKARIATGLSQRALAEKLGLKEQQIQRYEAERYASASLQRLQEIARAIGVRVQKNLLLPIKPVSFDRLMDKLGQVGIDREFLFTKLLPSADATRLDLKASLEQDDELVSSIAIPLHHVFGWPPSALLSAVPLRVPHHASAHARFKMPAGRSKRATNIYVTYANYIAITVVSGSRSLPLSNIPSDPKAVHRTVSAGGTLTLVKALHYAWDIGVPVIPLRDRGRFHGACWRYEGRNVIVLKQAAKVEARWIFDLFHELHHAGQYPDLSSFEVIEDDETSTERRNSSEEIAASAFAGEVTLNGRAEELAQACVQAAGGSVERLKGAVIRIADREGIGVGVLANYLAFRLSWQNINWWGAAANLQDSDDDPFELAKQVFFERFPFDVQSELDRQLLERALQ